MFARLEMLLNAGSVGSRSGIVWNTSVKIVLLKMLKNSARNCRRYRSVKRKFFVRLRSVKNWFGKRNGDLGEFPICPVSVVRNANGLNAYGMPPFGFAGIFSSGSLMMSGRLPRAGTVVESWTTRFNARPL